MVQGKTILIVGGSSGIGFATARRAAELGATPIIAGRSRARLDSALARLPSGALAEQVDFSDAANVNSLAERLGAIDHLVLSASSGVAWGSFATLTEAAVRAAFENKFWGYWRVAQALGTKLPNDGALVFVSGAAGRAAIPGTSGLAAVNGAIIAAAKVLAVELAPRRVNVVSPGMTETEAHAGMDLNARQGMYAAAAAKLPAGRIGKPENLAEAVLFALSNPFMTGAVIDIDGGVHLPRG